MMRTAWPASTLPANGAPGSDNPDQLECDRVVLGGAERILTSQRVSIHRRSREAGHGESGIDVLGENAPDAIEQRNTLSGKQASLGLQEAIHFLDIRPLCEAAHPHVAYQCHRFLEPVRRDSLPPSWANARRAERLTPLCPSASHLSAARLPADDRSRDQTAFDLRLARLPSRCSAAAQPEALIANISSRTGKRTFDAAIVAASLSRRSEASRSERSDERRSRRSAVASTTASMERDTSIWSLRPRGVIDNERIWCKWSAR